MTLNPRLMAVLLGTVAACAWHGTAVAASMTAGTVTQPGTELPAVSGINGKWELDPGILTGGVGLGASGSVSFPLGDRFGAQLDGMAKWGPNGLIYGGALHTFTRDPAKYLVGITSGIVVAPGKSELGAVGVEGELYMDRVSFEGWAGFAALDYVDPKMKDLLGAFGFGDVAYYATDDWRVSIGGSYVLGELALHGATEYQFTDMPLSLTGDAKLYADGHYSLKAGLKGYLGGNNDHKTLISRQRQDDPRDRSTDLFEGSDDLMFATAKTTPPPSSKPSDFTDQESCTDAGFHWWGYDFLHVPVGCHDREDPEQSASSCTFYDGFWNEEESLCFFDV